jgi:hypothetical protein
MAKQTHMGSCHCGRIRFEAKFDVSDGSGKCNCSICAKARLWGFRVKPEDFCLLEGEADLTDYQFNRNSCHHLFCKYCGVRAFEWSDMPQASGKYYVVMVACIDDLDIDELMAAPVRFFDGRNDKWREKPKEVRHL